MTAVEACKESLWMKEFIGELDIRQEEFQLYCDNKSTIHLAKNVGYHLSTKHIQWRYQLALRVSRRKRICSSEDPHGRKWIRYAAECVISRKAKRVPTKSRFGEVPHARVKGEFVGRQFPPDGKGEEQCR